jgi:hypothetical protein
MKMKKYLSIAFLLLMMASPVVFTSCGNDDPMEEVESPETKLDVWTEPYHIMGANVDEVESYMAQSMKRYRQVAETSGDNIQLTFMTGQGSEGVLYSFSRLDGSLYSVIDTERSVNRGLVIDYLKKHYTLVSADEASLLHQPVQIHGYYNHEDFRFLFQCELFIGLLIEKNKIATIRTSCSGGGSFRCLCVLEGASCSLLC